jgi:hypothetical protein
VLQSVAVNPELVIFKTELTATRLLSSDRYNCSTVHFHKTFWKGQEYLLATKKKKNKFCKMCIKVGETGDMNIPAVTPVLHRRDVTCDIRHRQQQRHVLDAGSRLC